MDDGYHDDIDGVGNRRFKMPIINYWYIQFTLLYKHRHDDTRKCFYRT